MSTLRDLAIDPRKALSDLEKKLGVQPGDLLRDMERLAPPGEEWGKHISWQTAVSYYDDERARSVHESHVDRCEYCKSLLDSIHPTSLDATAFASEAARLHSKSKRDLDAEVAPYALAASVLIGVVGVWSYLLAQTPPVSPPSVSPPGYVNTRPSSATHANSTVAMPKSRVSDVQIRSGTGVKPPASSDTPAAIPAGEPVKLVAEIEGAPADTAVSVVWRGPDDKELSVSTSWLKKGDKALAFTAENTAAWETGQYRAEIWVADKKILQQPFGITAQ
jgi:hypothetical protein